MGRPTRETVALLAGPIPIAVVTSGSTELATARLRGAGLEPPRAAGIAVVAFRTSHPEDELEGATVVLDTLAEAVARLI